MLNKKYVDSKSFTLDISEGLDTKGNRVTTVADPTSATNASSMKYVGTEARNYLKTSGTKVMSVIKSRAARANRNIPWVRQS